MVGHDWKRAFWAAAIRFICAASITLSQARAEQGARERQQCPSPAALRGSTYEKKIYQDVKRAYQPLPSGEVFATPLPRHWRGVIRRVDMPSGVLKVALTFDLCEQPHEVAGYDSAIVSFLRETKTRATFFAGGKWIVTHEERARQIISDPLFEVGNHTWEHRNLRLLKGQRLHNEINGAQLAYRNVHEGLVQDQCIAPDHGGRVKGIASHPAQPWLFRFPFGACDPESLRAVADAGLLAVQWDLSSGDPMRSLSAAHMADAVLHSVRSGSIVLFHANGRGWQTAQALRTIVPTLQARGYALVTVSDLLNTEGARPDFTQACYDSRPGDTNRYDNFSRSLEAVYEAFRAKHEPAQTKRTETDPRVLVVPKPEPAIRKRGEGDKGGDTNNAPSR